MLEKSRDLWLKVDEKTVMHSRSVNPEDIK